MTFFGRITNGTLDGRTVLVNSEKDTLYVECQPDELPETESFHLEIEDAVFCVDALKSEYGSYHTQIVPIRYSYGKEPFGPAFADCRRLEYTSPTLIKLMCGYGNQEGDIISDSFDMGEVVITFYGNRIYHAQQNPEFEPYNPRIVLEYGTEKRPEDIFRYVQAVDDFLRLVLFQKNIAAPRVKLTDDRQRDYLSFLIGDRRMYGELVRLEFGDRYEAVKKYIPVLFRYVLNRRVDRSWFEKYYRCGEHQALFFNTYAAFDRLSGKAYGSVPKVDEDFEKFKQKVWQRIEEEDGYEAVKDRIGNLRDKLMTHGRSYGHREKLRKAYKDCMLVIPQRADYYEMKDEKIMDRIYRLRTDIVHKGDAIKFSSFDIRCLEKLQWITYLLLLREIGIEDQDLENWMNRVMGVG